MKKTLLIIVLAFSLNAYCQKPVFITDSILQQYKENGIAVRNFVSGGKTDAKKMQQGMWVDYKIEKDFICYKEDGLIKQHFDSYLVYGEGNYYNGKRSGLWRLYLIEDKTFKKVLLQEATYKNGAKEGDLAYLLPDGTKGVTGTYHLDKAHGTFTNYYAGGAVFSEHNYIVGVLNGPCTFYYEDGKVKSEGSYTNNVKDGPQKLFYHTGQLQEMYTVKLGTEDGLYKYFYTNGQLSIEKEFKEGLLLAVKGNYTAAGAERNKGTIKRGNGTVIQYTPDGSIKSIQTFKAGKLIGEDSKLSGTNFN
jgi:antitoxin component YwqK of YwqJK toxin-antitoxin module